MSLNHTIRLINDFYTCGMEELISNHYEAKIILTKLNNTYFKDNKITAEDLKAFGELVLRVMNSQSSFYCVTPTSYLKEALVGYSDAGLTLRNLLTIPVTNDYCVGLNIPNRTMYDSNKVIHVLFYTKSCMSRRFNKTTLVDPNGSSVYPEFWSWFKGDEVKAYETIMKISSDNRDEILDPFMNNGLVGEAAINADRHFTGIEPDGGTFKATRTRLDCLGE